MFLEVEHRTPVDVLALKYADIWSTKYNSVQRRFPGVQISFSVVLFMFPFKFLLKVPCTFPF